MLTPQVKLLVAVLSLCLMLSSPAHAQLNYTGSNCRTLVVQDVRVFSRECAACVNREQKQAYRRHTAQDGGQQLAARSHQPPPPPACNYACGTCMAACLFDTLRGFGCPQNCTAACTADSTFSCSTAPVAPPSVSAAAVPAQFSSMRESCMSVIMSQARAMAEHGAACANRSLRPQQVIVLAVGATGAGDGKASPAGQVAPAQTSPPPPPGSLCSDACGACVNSCIAKRIPSAVQTITDAVRNYCFNRCMLDPNFVPRRPRP
jgi:hypothetical protein